MEIKRKAAVGRMQAERFGEIEYLTFPALDQTGIVRHMISTRLGGVSQGIFASMNYSYSRGDKKEAVDENFARTAAIFGRTAADFVCADQTHTVNVRRVTAEDRGKGVVCPRDYQDVDGLITNEPELILATFYADCVPLLFVDPVQRAIGCSHSGWRGTAGEMGRVTIQRMQQEFGSRPEDIYAAVGPSICQDCYEVSQDVAQVFERLFSEKRYETIVRKKEELLYPTKPGKYQLNLWKANQAVLLAAGIAREHLFVTDICTCCNPDYLFSHRASQGKRGNIGAFIMLTKN